MSYVMSAKTLETPDNIAVAASLSSGFFFICIPFVYNLLVWNKYLNV